MPKKNAPNQKAIEAAERRAEQEIEKSKKKAAADEQREAAEWAVGANARSAARQQVS